MDLEGLTGSFFLSRSSKGEPTSACCCVWFHDLSEKHCASLSKSFNHTNLCVTTDTTIIPSASALQVTAATPSGTVSLLKHYIMMLVLHELVFRDTALLKCRRWRLDALGGCLLYLPFKLWSPFPPWHLAWWLWPTSPPTTSNKSSFSNVIALESDASSAKSWSAVKWYSFKFPSHVVRWNNSSCVSILCDDISFSGNYKKLHYIRGLQIYALWVICGLNGRQSSLLKPIYP